jgi:hypothetical protein
LKESGPGIFPGTGRNCDIYYQYKRPALISQWVGGKNRLKDIDVGDESRSFNCPESAMCGKIVNIETGI